MRAYQFLDEFTDFAGADFVVKAFIYSLIYRYSQLMLHVNPPSFSVRIVRIRRGYVKRRKRAWRVGILWGDAVEYGVIAIRTNLESTSDTTRNMQNDTGQCAKTMQDSSKKLLSSAPALYLTPSTNDA
jgi:hypothetical protein